MLKLLNYDYAVDVCTQIKKKKTVHRALSEPVFYVQNGQNHG